MKTIYTLFALLLLTGCAAGPKPLYYWGNFPDQTYLMYSAPAKATASQQIEKLQADIQKAKAAQLGVPPGLYAHLGLMYLNEGNVQKSEEYFNLERQVYPESTTLINRMLGDKNKLDQGVLK